MSITTTALAALSSFMISVGAPPPPSDGLHTLATTGWADAYAKETGGMAYDKTGGTPEAFEYAIPTHWQFDARKLLAKGEFLAPHFSKEANGRVTVMIAPHLLMDGEVVKGAGMDDNFIIINPNGEAHRFDYSDDVMADSMTMKEKMMYKSMMMKDGMMEKGMMMKEHMMKKHMEMHKDMMMKDEMMSEGVMESEAMSKDMN